jgi:hypothetical protein
MRKIGKLLMLAIGLMVLAGCAAGGFSQLFSENEKSAGIKGRLALFPIEGGRYGEEPVKLTAQILTREGSNSRLFTEVIAPDQVQARLNERGVGRIYDEYIGKLRVLSFSDPALCDRLASALEVEYFLFAEIKYWGYSRLPEDRSAAKVGFILIMVEARTGRILGRETSYDSREFRFIRPRLEGVAQDLLVRMTREMMQKLGRGSEA